MKHGRRPAFTLIELLVVIAVIAIIDTLLFPVFAQAPAKARQAACFSNLRQIGMAQAMYVQDYDGLLPSCCNWGRAWTWQGVTEALLGIDPMKRCVQDGITRATPKDTVLGPHQTPPRYFQELLQPYCKNQQLWFCPGVAKDRLWWDADPQRVTYGFNGTSYVWNWRVDPGSDPRLSNPFRNRRPYQVSGLAVATIPRPAEAPIVWDMPYWQPIKEPCTRRGRKPPHAEGVNVLYADNHAKFSPFTNRVSQRAEPPCLEDWWAEHHWEGYFE